MNRVRNGGVRVGENLLISLFYSAWTGRVNGKTTANSRTLTTQFRTLVLTSKTPNAVRPASVGNKGEGFNAVFFYPPAAPMPLMVARWL